MSFDPSEVNFLINMNPMKLINMDESMKGLSSFWTGRKCHRCSFLLIVSGNFFMVFFLSHRLEVFKGLKVDTVLRNFTVFEYTKDEVSVLKYS